MLLVLIVPPFLNRYHEGTAGRQTQLSRDMSRSGHWHTQEIPCRWSSFVGVVWEYGPAGVYPCAASRERVKGPLVLTGWKRVGAGKITGLDSFRGLVPFR